MRMTLLLPALLALALIGCPGGEDEPTTGEAEEQIQERKTFVVVMDAAYPPFEFVEKDGSISGFDVELVKLIAEKMGAEAKFRNVAWEGIIPELMTGRADAIFSGMSITEKRKKAVLFTKPYAVVGQAILKRKGDDRIKSFKDLDDPELIVATQEGTTGEEAIKKHMPKVVKAGNMLRFKKADLACQAVVDGKADAVVFDLPFLADYMKKQNPDNIEGLWKPFTREPIGAAIRKDSPKLLEKINEILDELEKSGELQKLREKYFGDAAKNMKVTEE